MVGGAQSNGNGNVDSNTRGREQNTRNVRPNVFGAQVQLKHHSESIGIQENRFKNRSISRNAGKIKHILDEDAWSHAASRAKEISTGFGGRRHHRKGESRHASSYLGTYAYAVVQEELAFGREKEVCGGEGRDVALNVKKYGKRGTQLKSVFMSDHRNSIQGEEVCGERGDKNGWSVVSL